MLLRRRLPSLAKLTKTRPIYRPSCSSSSMAGHTLEPNTTLNNNILESSDAPQPTPVVLQYIVLRKDLWVEQGWPLGSIVAQACHASSAAMWESKDDPVTMLYCSPSNIDNMHKVRQFTPLMTGTVGNQLHNK